MKDGRVIVRGRNTSSISVSKCRPETGNGVFEVKRLMEPTGLMQGNLLHFHCQKRGTTGVSHSGKILNTDIKQKNHVHLSTIAY